MYFNFGNRCRTSAVAAVRTGSLLILASGLVSAETVKTVNGVQIDSSVVDFYVQSRLQKPPADVSAEERTQLLDELTDIYLLSTGDGIEQIENDPQIRAQLELQRRGVIAQTVASRYLAALEISDEEIQAEYESQTELAPPMQFKARHILVESQGEAEQLIKRLDDGADFEALAKDKSTGPSAPNGGDLGWFAPNQMVAPFSQAVVAMEDGEYSKAPVQTDFGWHVILREESRASEAPTLDSVRDEIQQVLQQRKFQTHLQVLREQGNIE